jgi:putative NADH-flavin reductase
MTRIAIIGGHGKVAMALSRLLTTAGHRVTGIIRKPEQQADVAGTGARPAMLDVEQASVAEMAAVLQGHDAVIWSAGACTGKIDVVNGKPDGGAQTARRNVALVAAAALARPGTAGRTIEFRDGASPVTQALQGLTR